MSAAFSLRLLVRRLRVSRLFFLLLGLLPAPPAPARAANPPDEHADVIVIGATPAGVSAAVAAARGGASVVLIEELPNVGGIITGGLTTADIGNNQATGGHYNEFRRGIRDYYAEKYGENSVQYEDCRAGRQHEPHVAEIVFRRMLAAEPRIRLLTGHYLGEARVEGTQLRSVIVRDVATEAPRHFTGRVFIDATYEGDLAAAAGAEYRVGREARSDHGESLAGRIYTRIAGSIGNDQRRVPMPGSTGEADAGIQAYCFRIHVTNVPANRVPFTKPATYDRNEYLPLLDDIKHGRVTTIVNQIFQFQKAPNGKWELNNNHTDYDRGGPSQSFDLAEENWGWPEASRAERKRIFDRYWAYQEGMWWFLQSDPEVPPALRAETASYGLCRDEFVATNNRPNHIYVRQGRRIVGEYWFTQREEDPDPATGHPRLHADSIGLANYPWDSHAVHKYDPKYPRMREGYYVVRHPPLQLPYGIIVPRKIDGLLVPVACSATHVGYQTIRMEPVFMALGQAAGTAAALALESGVPVRRVAVPLVQAELVRRGGVITYYEDLYPTHPAFAAIQFLGARGFGRDFFARPDDVLSAGDAAAVLGRIVAASGSQARPGEGGDGPLTAGALGRLLGTVGLPATLQGAAADRILTRGEFARAVAASLGFAL